MKRIPRLFRIPRQGSLIRRRGVLTRQTITTLLGMTEQKLNTLEDQVSVRRKVFHAVTEALQNAGQHGHRDSPDPHSIFMLGLGRKNYTIITINAMMKSRIVSLREKLRDLNNQNNAGLRASYLRRLQHGRISGEGGAGLGLMRLARISNRKLRFQFSEIDHAHSYFMLKLSVQKGRIFTLI